MFDQSILIVGCDLKYLVMMNMIGYLFWFDLFGFDLRVKAWSLFSFLSITLSDQFWNDLQLHTKIIEYSLDLRLKPAMAGHNGLLVIHSVRNCFKILISLSTLIISFVFFRLFAFFPTSIQFVCFRLNYTHSAVSFGVSFEWVELWRNCTKYTILNVFSWKDCFPTTSFI